MRRTTTYLLYALLIVILASSACMPSSQTGSSGQEPVTLRIAVLPIVDTLPLYVAQQEGLFAARGVKVELIPVASAPERMQLIAAGQADGTIDETLATMLFNRETIQTQVVRYALRPAPGYGHFFILASAQSGIIRPDQLRGVEIGIAQGTIIEYVTERLLMAEGLSPEEIRTVSVPKIPDRMALLVSGKLDAATLPDPLSALAVQSGAVVVVDDSRYPEYGFSVYSFRKEVIDAHPDAVRGFLAAVEEAVARINADPQRYRDLLMENKIVPSEVTEYRVPPFPAAGVPTRAEWDDMLEWARGKGLLDVDVSYEQSVNGSLLP